MIDDDDEVDLQEKPGSKALVPLWKNLPVELQEFIAVSAEDDDKEHTHADVNYLNNLLAMMHACIPSIRTIEGLCTLSNAAANLIEKRRKVKKLPYGAVTEKNKTWEVLE